MRSFWIGLVMLALALGGCGGGGDDSSGDDQAGNPDSRPATPDAPPMTQNVSMVACTGTPPLVTTPSAMYSPQTTMIAVNGLVHFDLGDTHNVVSTTAGQAFGLDFGADACLQFRAAGTYTFKCGPHNFTGMVVVQ